MDQPFHMSIHHGGVFITHSDAHVEYARGIETRVSDFDPDTFVVFDMRKYAENLDIIDVAEFLYQIPQMELHNGLCPFKEVGDVRAIHGWLEFVPKRLIYIYVKHIEEVVEEQVDEDQGNEGDERVGEDDNFFDEDYIDLVGDSELDRYERPSSPIDSCFHIVHPFTVTNPA